jgi:hypothetical protein
MSSPLSNARRCVTPYRTDPVEVASQMKRQGTFTTSDQLRTILLKLPQVYKTTLQDALEMISEETNSLAKATFSILHPTATITDEAKVAFMVNKAYFSGALPYFMRAMYNLGIRPNEIDPDIVEFRASREYQLPLSAQVGESLVGKKFTQLQRV